LLAPLPLLAPLSPELPPSFVSELLLGFSALLPVASSPPVSFPPADLTLSPSDPDRGVDVDEVLRPVSTCPDFATLPVGVSDLVDRAAVSLAASVSSDADPDVPAADAVVSVGDSVVTPTESVVPARESAAVVVAVSPVVAAVSCRLEEAKSLVVAANVEASPTGASSGAVGKSRSVSGLPVPSHPIARATNRDITVMAPIGPTGLLAMGRVMGKPSALVVMVTPRELKIEPPMPLEPLRVCVLPGVNSPPKVEVGGELQRAGMDDVG
jgi:hypothetical protein